MKTLMCLLMAFSVSVSAETFIEPKDYPGCVRFSEMVAAFILLDDEHQKDLMDYLWVNDPFNREIAQVYLFVKNSKRRAKINGDTVHFPANSDDALKECLKASGLDKL